MTEREKDPLCIDCRFFSEPENVNGCTFLMGRPHPVYGSPMTYIKADAMRLGPCGLNGRLFKPREESK